MADSPNQFPIATETSDVERVYETYILPWGTIVILYDNSNDTVIIDFSADNLKPVYPENSADSTNLFIQDWVITDGDKYSIVKAILEDLSVDPFAFNSGIAMQRRIFSKFIENGVEVSKFIQGLFDYNIFYDMEDDLEPEKEF